jgi:ribosomal protein S18 acetylase RimI-like enzyme
VTLFAIREGRAGDVAFIRDRWLMTDRHSLAARDVGRGYMRLKKMQIASILQDSRTVVTVAHVEGEEDANVGFVVARPLAAILYFAYVRPEARRLGLVRRMLAASGAGADIAITYTHRPQPRIELPEAWSYDPYLNAERP